MPKRGMQVPWRDMPSSCAAVAEYKSYDEVDKVTAEAIMAVMDQRVEAALSAPVNTAESLRPLATNAQADPGVTAVLQRVEKDLGKVLYCGWSGSRVWDVRTVEPHLFIVYQTPLPSLLALKPPIMHASNARQETPTYAAIELGAFCRGLLTGAWRCVESLFLPSLCGPNALFDALSERVRDQVITHGLVEALLVEIKGRAGLRGIQALMDETQRSIRTTHAKHLCHFAMECLVGRFDDGEAQRRQSHQEEKVELLLATLEGHFLANTTLPDVVDPSSQISEWLLSVRLQGLPPKLAPLLWEPERASVKLCPWPLLVLAKRPDMTAREAQTILLGVYLGDTKAWLAHKASVARAPGDRGWGELAIRGKGFVLHELGRFTELIVWGNPFVLEMLYACVWVHETPEWKQLLDLAKEGALLSPKAILQVMGAVTAQLKLLISAGTPFEERDVELASLLHYVRGIVVQRVGPAESHESFNDFNYWREDFAVKEEEEEDEDEAQRHTFVTATIPGPGQDPPTPREDDGGDDRDSPAYRMSDRLNLRGEQDLDLDHSGLREVLIELDELRHKWSVSFPSPSTIQDRLNDWLQQIRLRSLVLD